MKYENIKYNECDEVYPPAEDTFLLIDNLIVKNNDSVLEVGCGCGIVSIAASLNAEKVTSIDINPHAIKCTKEKAAGLICRAGPCGGPGSGEAAL